MSAFHSKSVCAGCGCTEEDFGSVNVEAFELTGELWCEDCAENAINSSPEAMLKEHGTW